MGLGNFESTAIDTVKVSNNEYIATKDIVIKMSLRNNVLNPQSSPSTNEL